MTPRYDSPIPPTEPERVDSIPVVLAILIRLGVQDVVDERHTPHGNRLGLSVGWLTTIFLAYILTETDHRMCPVQKWVVKHRYTLERLTDDF